MARDDWVDDEVTLAEITKHQDFIGEWWNVPAEHLQSCMMALSYLDAGGMIFYLPAFMTALIERPEDFDKCHRSSSWQVAFTMLPEREDPKTAAAFLSRFSLMDEGKKHICREFLAYLSMNAAYNEHAREIAKEALAHEFWSTRS